MAEHAASGAAPRAAAGTRARRTVEAQLAQADVRLDGARPWDVRVLDERLFARIAAQGSLGIGDAYVDGWWECEALDTLCTKVHRAGLLRHLRPGWAAIKARLFNLQRPTRAFEVGKRHYDIGNDLYQAMLDRRMIYTCAYWRDAADLDAAQEAKLDLVCRKLGLRPGMRVLDVGCGWGGAARFAAERYGVAVTGCTVSEQQARLAREHCAGVDVDIRVQDYRDLEGRFDRVYSLGMFEHVGYKNYATYMRVVRRLLQPDGLFLLHTIGSNRSVVHTDPWIERYIFPNSMLPSISQIGAAIEDHFIMEDWHNFGPDYDRTLMCWHANFERAWARLAPRYGERFRRMWRYFLLASAGSFRARSNQLWQLVLSPHGTPGTYAAPR